jgi:GTPase SAR1 family protein
MLMTGYGMFVTDSVLGLDDICNLKRTRNEILEAALSGKKVVLFGPRNTGKTSLLKSIVIPEFQKRHPKSIVVFMDVMDVKSEDDFARRLQLALEEGVAVSKGAKEFLQGLVRVLKQIRPRFQVDPYTNETTFSLGLDGADRTLPFGTVLKEIGKSHEARPALLVIDEFQDIDAVPTLAAKLRRSMQELPADLPVIVSGSKKHILSRMFADARAPFAGWGRPLEIETLSVEDYLPYANERFGHIKLSMTEDACCLLLERMRHIPEPANLICEYLTRHRPDGAVIGSSDVLRGIKGAIKERSPFYLARLGRYSEKEQRFLKALADVGHEKQPTGKAFLKRANLSASGCLSLLHKLEDGAMICKGDLGYYVADPLLEVYLQEMMR